MIRGSVKVATVPDLVVLWDAERNIVTPEETSVGSNALRHWRCPEGPDHLWSAKVSAVSSAVQKGHRGCPFCANRRPSATNRLDLLHPDVAAQWHPSHNGAVLPSDVASTTHGSFWWLCPVGQDHEWQAPVVLRTSRQWGCPFCSNRQLSTTNSVAARYPEHLHLWHPTRNLEPPERTLANTEVKVWWKCPQGPDHEWYAAPGRLAVNSWARGKTGCPACAGKRASVTNSVASIPVLAASWHPTRNLPVTSHEVPAGTAKKYWWLCPDCGHEWRSIGANRGRRGCPACKVPLRSTLEICLLFELATMFPRLPLDGDKVVIGEKVRHVDVRLDAALLRATDGGGAEEAPTNLAHEDGALSGTEPGWRGIVIELDGRYHHEGRDEHDAAKSEVLRASGWHVTRVREEPLAATHQDDVVVAAEPTVKVVADAVLARCLERGWLTGRGADNARTYIAETSPRRLAAAIGEVRRTRPGKSVRIPGTPKGPSRRDRWERNYDLLLDYVAEHGTADVPYEHVSVAIPPTEPGTSGTSSGKAVRLGAWVGIQRSRFRSGRLSSDRQTRLEELPGWTWDPVEDAWEIGYQHLLRFAAREGHIRVPAEHTEDDAYPLGSWVRSHRRRGGGRRTITTEQAARLEAVEGWTYDSPIDQFWDRACSAVEGFAAREGTCELPPRYVEDGVNLSAWMSLQRTRWRAGDLSSEQIQRLEAIAGWSWSPNVDAWEAGFHALQTFTSREGHALVPREHREGGYPLGSWVGEQRHRDTTLPPERRARLQEIAGWSFDPHADRWEAHYDALLTFVAREGHAAVPTDHTEAGLNLGSWVIRHRTEHKQGAVPSERASRLENLPGWMWDTREAAWARHTAAVRAFAAREGNARVPSDWIEPDNGGGVTLGAWVVATRFRHKQHDIDATRVAELEAIPGWCWDARTAVWDDHLTQLEHYAARTGSCRVPGRHIEGGLKLGQWVQVQRRRWAQGRLRADRSKRLEAVEGWYWTTAASEQTQLF